MNKNQILDKIRDIRLMPLFYHDDEGIALEVMKAVFEGGIKLLEFTNRGKNAFSVFKSLHEYKISHYEDAALGIGSVVDPETAIQYIEAGSDFVVSPLLSKEVVNACNERKMLHIPGCSTLTEIHQAELWGAEIVKIFPAEQLGGPAYIKAIKGPCPWLSIVVTGGVKAEAGNLKEWHDAGAEAFGLGSDLISKELIRKGDFRGLTKKAEELVRIVEDLKKP